MINGYPEEDRETRRQGDRKTGKYLSPCLPLSKSARNQNGQPPMTQQIQVAAIDLDDTLLRSDGSISPRSLLTLRAWRAAGNQIVIATGRPRRTVATVLPAELHDAPLVSYNGAEIHTS